jgi:diaminopimelate epimerase
VSKSLHFSKYQGLGNDFIIADLRDGEPSPSPQRSDIVRAVCDRRFGVGGDGILALLPPTTASAVARMRVLNADGSEAEMCGNGIRCVVKYLLESDAESGDTLTVDTGAGPLTCSVIREGDTIAGVRVNMGRARLSRCEIPMTGPADERAIAVPLRVGDHELALTAVSMGNPHAIAFVDASGPALRALAEEIGPQLEHHEWFPNRTNVEFAHVASPTDIELVVWERGCGITLACGTGACATAAAACLNGKAEIGTAITVRLLGGPLTIVVDEDYQAVHMTGPATHVYDADIDLSALDLAAFA